MLSLLSSYKSVAWSSSYDNGEHDDYIMNMISCLSWKMRAICQTVLVLWMRKCVYSSGLMMMMMKIMMMMMMMKVMTMRGTSWYYILICCGGVWYHIIQFHVMKCTLYSRMNCLDIGTAIWHDIDMIWNVILSFDIICNTADIKYPHAIGY